MKKTKYILFYFLFFSIFILILELSIRLFTPFPITPSSNQKYHPELGYVLKKNIADVDNFGFRSMIKYEDADLVVIGDSHTYGYDAHTKDSFVSFLDNAYNAGIPSYGIFNYIYLSDIAIKNNKNILITLYPQNDFIYGKSFCYIDFNSDFWVSKLEELKIKIDNSICKKNDLKKDQNIKAVLKSIGIISILDYYIYTPISSKLSKKIILKKNNNKFEFDQLRFNAVYGNGASIEKRFYLLKYFSKYLNNLNNNKKKVNIYFMLIPSREDFELKKMSDKNINLKDFFNNETLKNINDYNKKIKLIEKLIIENNFKLLRHDVVLSNMKENIEYWGGHPNKYGYKSYAESVIMFLENTN